MSQQQSLIELEELERLSQESPTKVIRYSEDLKYYLLSGTVDQRREAIRIVVHLSDQIPFQLDKLLNAIQTRLNDTDAEVRVNAAVTVGNLAQWYPQEFKESTDILSQFLLDGNSYEKAVGARAIAVIGEQRPDIVASRVEVLHELESLSSEENLQKLPNEVPEIHQEILDRAIDALRGGDLESRPLESDLSPVGRATKLSSPARVGIIGFLIVPITISVVLAILTKIIVAMLQDNQRRRREQNLLDYIRFFKDKHRARLYLRQSRFPLPANIVGWIPGEAPRSGDYTNHSQPENWSEIIRSVWERDEKQCRNCYRQVKPETESEPYIDVKKPVSDGGELHPRNLRTLCFGCLQAADGEIYQK